MRSVCEKEKRGEGNFPNVSTCTNKEVAEGSTYQIGMNRGISQHTPSMRCAMREKTPKIETMGMINHPLQRITKYKVKE